MRSCRSSVSGVRAAGLVALLASGCVDYMGFPPGSLYEDDPQSPEGDYFDDLDEQCSVFESESNDNPDGLGFDSVGTLFPGDQRLVCGTLTSLSTDADGYYTGDKDWFLFSLDRSSQVDMVLSWSMGANLDLHFMSYDGKEYYVSYDENPERLSLSLSAGPYLAHVVGASGEPGTYVLTLTVD